MTYYNIIEKNNKSGYGIKITKERIIENISCDYSTVSHLIDICNRNEVDMDHFDDILENFLSDGETFW